MSTKLYADDRCIAEFFSANELRKMAGQEPIEPKEEKKIHNCPNCGAPLTSYICEYCGTEFEKPKKKLSKEAMRESFAEFARKQRQAELQASQEWQTQNLLNSLNSYIVNTQIMNMRDSINASMALQTCSLHDQLFNASMQTNIYPANHDIEQQIPISKDGTIEDEEYKTNKRKDTTAVTLLSLFFVFLIIIVISYLI